MGSGSLVSVLPRLREASLATHSAASDAELLERFISQRDDVAFEVMLRRHGPMVLAVCLRVLRHAQDAEDAFQATFLVLAHKAASVSPRSKLAGWLHGVASRTALKARHRAAHRQEVEKRVSSRRPDEMPDVAHGDEAEMVLDQEIAGLPDPYRLPIILCDLEGRLRVEVAALLGCSEGTLSSRLTRGRRMLADRLKRRGVTLCVTATGLVLTAPTVTLAESLILATVPIVFSSLAAPAGVGSAVPPSVAQLATGVMKSMFLKKIRIAVLAGVFLLTLAVVAAATYPSNPPPVTSNALVLAGDQTGFPDTLPDSNGRLLLDRKVLKDMKCDIDQLDRIMDALEAADQKSRQKVPEAFTELRAKSNGERLDPQVVRQKLQEAREAGEKEFQKATADVVQGILTPVQRKRFLEIDLQSRGCEAFTVPAVAKALELTVRQKEQLTQNSKQVEEAITQARQQIAGGGIGGGGIAGGGAAGGGARPGGLGGGGVNPETAAKAEKLMKDARDDGMKRAIALLTEEQKATWKKLAGEPFTHPLNNVRRAPIGGPVGGAAPGLPPRPAGPVVPPANPIKP